MPFLGLPIFRMVFDFLDVPASSAFLVTVHTGGLNADVELSKLL